MIQTIPDSNPIHLVEVQPLTQNKWVDLTEAYKKASSDVSHSIYCCVLAIVAAVVVVAAGVFVLLATIHFACPPLFLVFIAIEGLAGLIGKGVAQSCNNYSKAKAAKKNLLPLMKVMQLYEAGKQEEARKVFDHNVRSSQNMSSLQKLVYQNCGW